MNSATLGLVAGAFTTLASLPQIVYVLRTRSMRDVSLVTLCMFASGVGLWFVYGVVINAMPVIVWNVISLALYLVQIGLKLATSANDVGDSPSVLRVLARSEVKHSESETAVGSPSPSAS